eukprot:366167_1
MSQRPLNGTDQCPLKMASSYSNLQPVQMIQQPQIIYVQQPQVIQNTAPVVQQTQTQIIQQEPIEVTPAPIAQQSASPPQNKLSLNIFISHKYLTGFDSSNCIIINPNNNANVTKSMHRSEWISAMTASDN